MTKDQRSATSTLLSTASLSKMGRATRPSVTRRAEIPISALNNIRRFHEEEVLIDKTKVLGRGVFGKCYHGYAGPQSVCVKVLRKDPLYNSSYNNEAYMLSQCCQRNISFLVGLLTTSSGYKCLLTAFHGIDGNSYTVHSLLDKDDTLRFLCWKNVILGIARGLLYLHNHRNGVILHNDLKCDNVVLDKCGDAIESRIIDFGKACFEENARLYHLSLVEKETYRTKHPQIAPDVRDGLKKQSPASDAYSFGRIILSIINSKKLTIPGLSSLAGTCLEYNMDKRPKTIALYTFMKSLM